MNVGNPDQVYPNLEEVVAVPPPGWHIDPDSGAWMRDTIHHMGRRCQNWDYHGTGSYQITLVLNDRSQSLFGELVGPHTCPGIDAGERQAHFAAIGNQSLLQSPHILQVQCSRRYFAYRRQPNGDLIKESPYATITREFEEKCECLLAASTHGAVLVSPCISQGEKEIARRAFQAGHKVITLANKGFSPLYKPGGKLFDQCANGNLLMLAPIRWEYLPGEKKMTRLDACALNRIAQLLAGDGAVEIDYKGTQLGNIDRYVMDILMTT